MTSKLYTRYQELDEVDKNSNEFKEVPIFNDWSIKRDWNKAGSLTFKSPTYLKPGTHVKLVSTDHKTFGGQIVKKTEDSSDFYSYDCLDYKKFLLTSKSYSPVNKTSSQILKALVDTFTTNKQILEFKISKTKNVFPSLVFQDKPLLEIITNLLSLEYKRGTLIYFDVDENGTLTWKPYPQEIKGYSLSIANKYTNSLDYSEIATSYSLLDPNNSTLKSSTNWDLSNIWGVINLTKTLTANNTTTNESNKSDKEISRIVLDINKQLRNTSYNSCDCFCMSDRIFNKLKAHHVPCKIISYYSPYASSGTHRTVMYKNSKGWKDFNYNGFSTMLKPMSVRKNLKDPFEGKIYNG